MNAAHGGGNNHETTEAREIRDRYNARSEGAIPHQMQYIALPCSAGVVWVDLTEVGDPDTLAHHGLLQRQPSIGEINVDAFQHMQQRPGKRKKLFAEAREGFARFAMGKRRESEESIDGSMQAAEGAPAASGPQPLRRQQTVSFLGRRRPRQNSGEPEVDEGAGGAAGAAGSYTADEEEVALELLTFELPPRCGAEDAKAAATRSAQICEEAVNLEMQVRQMWRIGMGNATGLKAEVAKLHATERAKSALHEFEKAERARAAAAAAARQEEKAAAAMRKGSGARSGTPPAVRAAPRRPSKEKPDEAGRQAGRVALVAPGEEPRRTRPSKENAFTWLFRGLRQHV